MAMERLENLNDDLTEGWSNVRVEEERVERGGWIVDSWGLRVLKCVICECYDFIFYAFRYFEPVECLDNRSDVVVFGGFSNSTGENILNRLKAVYLGDVYVQEERIAVV